MRLSLAGLGLLLACSGSGRDTESPAGASPTTAQAPAEPGPGGASVPEDGGAPIPAASCPAVSACPGDSAVPGIVTPLDPCAFPIEEAPTSEALAKALAGLAKPAPLPAVLADLNRAAVPTTAVPGVPSGVTAAFRWAAEDDASTTWIPQGITGSADASATGIVAGRRVILVSAYHAPPGGAADKGVRLAVVDVTNPAAPSYRFALLVEPKGTVAAPTFAPVAIHAGGLAWIGDLLYVPDTNAGLRVFDLAAMLEVKTDLDVVGCVAGACRAGQYKYVVPQVGMYRSRSACAPLFSYVGLDRGTSPPSLVTGEYCGGQACGGVPLAGRAFRWPLAREGARLAAGLSYPSQAYRLGHAQVQGLATVGGELFLSSSAPEAGKGALFRAPVGAPSRELPWVDAPEDLLWDGARGELWGLSEAAGARVVFGVPRTSLAGP